MCWYVTIVAPAAAADDLSAVCGRFLPGWVPHRVFNASVQALMSKGEAQFCSSGACDCGTAIGTIDEAWEDPERIRLERRYQRRGWTEDRIQRVMRERNQRTTTPRDSVEAWAAVISEVAAQHRRAGVLYRYYEGDLESEAGNVAIAPTRPTADAAWHLARLPQNVLQIFVADRSSALLSEFQELRGAGVRLGVSVQEAKSEGRR